jgi:hypothetical protein
MGQIMGAMGSMKKMGIPPGIGAGLSSMGITKGAVAGVAKGYAGQFGAAAKSGLNQRMSRMASGLTAKIAGAPPTPTPAGIQNAKPPSMPCHCPM